MSKPIQLIIPAAGSGKRFTEQGFTMPKPLINVGDLPMLLWVLGNFELQDDDRVLIISQMQHQIRETIEKNLESSKLSCNYLECEKLTDGPASTVLLAEKWLHPEYPVVVANSDQFVSHGLPNFINHIRSFTSDSYILTMLASGNKWSYIERDSNAKIVNVVEKYEVSSEATVGIYAWANPAEMIYSIKKQMEYNSRVNNEFYIAPTYNFLLQRGLDIETILCGNYADSVHGIGTPEDLELFMAREEFPLDLKNVRSRLFG